jgi:hypothetical protein
VAQGASQSMADVPVEEGTGDGVTLPTRAGGVTRWRWRAVAVDDLRRAVLVEPFSNDPTIEIIGQASTRHEAVEPAHRCARRRRRTARDRQPATDRQPSRRRAPIGRVGTPPGPRQAHQGQEAGAVSGRGRSTSTGLATDTV